MQSVDSWYRNRDKLRSGLMGHLARMQTLPLPHAIYNFYLRVYQDSDFVSQDISVISTASVWLMASLQTVMINVTPFFVSVGQKLFVYNRCCWILSHAGQNYWMLIGWDRGHFFLIKRAWLLDADWLSTPTLNWFPASNRFRNASLLSLILTRSFHPNVKENQRATKRSLLVEKQKDFSDQKRIDSQPENSLIGDGWCWTKH